MYSGCQKPLDNTRSSVFKACPGPGTLQATFPMADGILFFWASEAPREGLVLSQVMVDPLSKWWHLSKEMSLLQGGTAEQTFFL